MEKADTLLIKEAEEAGFDMSLIELNLSLSHSERVEKHQAALSLVEEIEKAKEQKG